MFPYFPRRKFDAHEASAEGVNIWMLLRSAIKYLTCCPVFARVLVDGCRVKHALVKVYQFLSRFDVILCIYIIFFKENGMFYSVASRISGCA